MKIKRAARCVAAALSLVACAHASATVIYAITSSNSLISFDSATPGTTSSALSITGLGANELIRGIDFRPLNGLLYGLGSANNLYTINTATGAATLIGSGLTLNGTSFGFDFNPVPDRIRVTSNSNENLRLNPADAVAVIDTNLAFGAGDPNFGVDPNVVGSAYTNSFAGAVSTTLYGIDSGLDILLTQNPPNNGVLNTVGALGVDVTDEVGFDILADGNVAFAAFAPPSGVSSLYTINLSTGAATLIGGIGERLVVTAIAVQQPTQARVPEPSSIVLLATGLLALLAMGRRPARYA